MTEAELFSLFIETEAMNDASFAIWITVTFAVLIAAFFKGASLDKALLRTITGLYLVSTILICVRMLGYGAIGSRVIGRVNEVESPVIQLSTSFHALMGILTLIIIVGGTVATVMYVRRSSQGQNSNPNV